MSQEPLLSVIVPVHRHWDLIPDLLAALGAQTLDAERFEILIVDNDGAAPDLATAPNARMLACPAPGSYAARNAGVAAARGSWFAFTDADCRPAPGWLTALVAAAAETPGHLLAGPVGIAPPARDTPAAVYDRVRGIPQARYVTRGYAATANLAVPREAFRAAGGFAPERFSGGDAAFCRAAGARGFPIRLVPEAEVVHLCRTTLEGDRHQGAAHQGRPDPRRLPAPARRLDPAYALPAAARHAGLSARALPRLRARHGDRGALPDLGRGARRDGPAACRRRAGAALIAAPSSPRPPLIEDAP